MADKRQNVNSLSKMLFNDDSYDRYPSMSNELRNALMMQETLGPETKSRNPNVAPYGGERQFLPATNIPLRNDPNVDLNLFTPQPPPQFNTSIRDERAQQLMQDVPQGTNIYNQDQMNMPQALLGQLRGSTSLGPGMARVGATGIAVQMPDGSIKYMPNMYDAGYGMPFLGGRLDVSGNMGAQTMPKRMYGGNIRFSKEFD